MLVSVLHTSLHALFPGERIDNVIDTSGEFLSDFFFWKIVLGIFCSYWQEDPESSEQVNY